MRIFVCEYVTGGGMAGLPLPESLAREGDLMVRALTRDLLALPGVEVMVSRDYRLEPLDMTMMIMATPSAHDDVWRFWDRCIREADAVWPIAPEAGGILERLSALVLERGRILLGSRPGAVRVAGSKRAAAVHLRRHGVPVVTTRPADSALPRPAAGWVVKPDDGAGCADTRLFRNRRELQAWCAAHGSGSRYVVQPYIPGIPASLSLLCHEGAARILACNRQWIEVTDGAFHFRGSAVNAVWDRDGTLGEIGRAVAAALPGLWGYVGVDVVLTEAGPVVLEINPRLTTSYAGLRSALGVNPAGLVLELLDQPERALTTQPGRGKTAHVEAGMAGHG